MNKIFIVGFTLTIGGFFWMLMSDMWSYFSEFTPPAYDEFYALMLVVWRIIPPFVFMLGIIILLMSGKIKNVVQVDE